MKGLDDFRRHAAAGRLHLEIVEQQGRIGEDIPKALRGIRKVVSANGLCAWIRNPNGTASKLQFTPAKLVCCEGDMLTVYEPGLRELTPLEQNVLDECQKLVDKFLSENPNGNPYWVRAGFFAKSRCPWMMGNATIRGKQYDASGKVRDNSIRGKVTTRYKIHIK